MSLIHSALKKAEEEKQRIAEPGPGPVETLAIDHIVALAEKQTVKAQEIQGKAERQIEDTHQVLTSMFLGLGLLAVALLWFLFSFLPGVFKAKHVRMPAAVAVAPVHSVRPAAQEVKPQAVSEQVPVASAVQIPSPSAVPEDDAKFKAQFKLTGVLSSGGSRIAMVNDKLVEVGSLVGSATVMEIGERSVTLEKNGKKFVVTLPGES